MVDGVVVDTGAAAIGAADVSLAIDAMTHGRPKRIPRPLRVHAIIGDALRVSHGWPEPKQPLVVRVRELYARLVLAGLAFPHEPPGVKFRLMGRDVVGFFP